MYLHVFRLVYGASNKNTCVIFTQILVFFLYLGYKVCSYVYNENV